MSAPTLSSFPPTFSSFPDLEPGPSTRTARQEKERKEKEEEKKKKKKKKKESKHYKRVKQEEEGENGGEMRKKKHKEERHEERSASTGAWRGSRSRSRSPRRHERPIADHDERRKLEEDRIQRRDGVERPSARSGLVYFTDCKGDPLNVRYDGLYAGDVPRYHLVGCKSSAWSLSEN